MANCYISTIKKKNAKDTTDLSMLERAKVSVAKASNGKSANYAVLFNSDGTRMLTGIDDCKQKKQMTEAQNRVSQQNKKAKMLNKMREKLAEKQKKQ